MEQNVHKALEVADRAYIIESGRIIEHGDAKDLLHEKRIMDAYLGIESA